MNDSHLLMNTESNELFLFHPWFKEDDCIISGVQTVRIHKFVLTFYVQNCSLVHNMKPFWTDYYAVKKLARKWKCPRDCIRFLSLVTISLLAYWYSKHELHLIRQTHSKKYAVDCIQKNKSTITKCHVKFPWNVSGESQTYLIILWK